MGKLTQDEKDAIRDAAVAQWWKDWFAADYSWEGLADKPWQGWTVVTSKAAYDGYIKTYGLPEGCPNTACQVVPADFDSLPEGTKTRPATLQDYWRDQEKRLEGKDGGKQYTIAHLPVQFKNGEDSWKADPEHQKWEALSALITARLECGAKTDLVLEFGPEHIVGIDRRANFRGCILSSLPPETTRAEKPTSPKTYDDEDLALHLSLEQAAILQRQNFTGAIFGSPTNFSHTLFDGSDISFRHAEFFEGDTDFGSAQFSRGDTCFDDARFSAGHVYFSNAKFSGFDATFCNAEFSGGNAYFRNAQFSGGDADFLGAQFSGGSAYFYNTQFSGGDANFYNAQFSGGDASFHNTQFSGGDANFYNAQFSGGDAYFTDARLEKGLNFKGARFDKRTIFINTIFPSAAGSQSAFRGTQFLGPADFSRTKFREEPKAGEDVGKTLPETDLHFPFNAFAHANIKDQLILTQRGDKSAQDEFDRALKSTEEAGAGETDDKIEAHYVALEAGCTTLKQAMEKVSDRNRAQRYFKFELLARQRRPSSSPIVKLFTRFYGWTADYGGSIWRPFGTLICLTVLCWLIYAANAAYIADSVTERENTLSEALGFSISHIFRPFFIWSKIAAANDVSWFDHYRTNLSGWGWLSVKLLATVQSFLSVTLLFLFGLATKRKFQIS
jgi:hypothetical protein